MRGELVFLCVGFGGLKTWMQVLGVFTAQCQVSAQNWNLGLGFPINSFGRSGAFAFLPSWFLLRLAPSSFRPGITKNLRQKSVDFKVFAISMSCLDRTGLRLPKVLILIALSFRSFILPSVFVCLYSHFLSLCSCGCDDYFVSRIWYRCHSRTTLMTSFVRVWAIFVLVLLSKL